MNKAKELIDNNIHSCIVVKDEEILYTANGIGIKPLLNIYLDNKQAMENSFIADKLIGKAAAMILICGKVKKVYGNKISKSAIDILTKNDIEYEYKELIEKVHNRDKTDLCPMEKTVLKIIDPEEGVNAILKFLSK